MEARGGGVVLRWGGGRVGDDGLRVAELLGIEVEGDDGWLVGLRAALDGGRMQMGWG